MRTADSQRRWGVGELATLTGLTVRALRHYDEIGLLVPSERSSAGHRRYQAADVQRLYEILALRQLGLPLAEVASVLDNSHDARAVVRRQLQHLEGSIAAAQRLRSGLQALLATLEATPEPRVHALTKLIKETIAMKNRITSEELDALTEGRRRMTQHMTAAQFAELAQLREEALARLPSDQLDAMARRRSTLTSADDPPQG